MLNFEKKYYSKNIKFIAGTDEAGRGPIVGPVVAAAVIFPKDYVNEEINDSKKLNAKKREALEKIIKQDSLAYSVSFISAKEIDKINIYEASRKAMINALHTLKHKYDMVITDAMPLPMEACKVIPLVKADAKVLAVAAASILAKVARDKYMDELDKKYPKYMECLMNVETAYNKECDRLDILGDEGRVLVLYPSKPLDHISRIEPDMEKLGWLYYLGYNDTLAQMNRIQNYLA